MAKRTAICPMCGKRHSVKRDQYLNKTSLWRAHRWLARIGYDTTFYCDAFPGRYYISKHYDENFKEICFTTSWCDLGG